ncbi:hypothetical protein L3X38_037851 [Prunus dulcis]|uniref:Uncharacterized protein n=1 Tax=Prunus dulcis TaxID=3755 RepID=A0AAD4YRL9_PRUDU|nr:hypothetical protein L3X38_037851 [Prunus dulcis]
MRFSSKWLGQATGRRTSSDRSQMNLPKSDRSPGIKRPITGDSAKMQPVELSRRPVAPVVLFWFSTCFEVLLSCAIAFHFIARTFWVTSEFNEGWQAAGKLR